jgi:DNA-binding transcriptional MocR family regulator
LIAQRAKAKGMKVDASDLLITTGSQQAIDLITRVLVDPGDRVAVEAPTAPTRSANCMRTSPTSSWRPRR